MRFTVSAATRDKLRRAQELLRHAVPSGDVAEIIDRALTALLDDLARKKLGAAKRPRPPRLEPETDGPRGVARTRRNSRHVPAHVKRSVWARDGGRCAFRGRDGRRCSETAWLEFHHREPYGMGGEATPANIELRCRTHNLYEGELVFGRAAWAEREAGSRSGTSSGFVMAGSEGWEQPSRRGG